MKNGGPAFPQPVEIHGRGLSMRDYFAAVAMQGFLSGPSMEVVTDSANVSKMDEQTFIVRTAYQIADAMLAEREKSK